MNSWIRMGKYQILGLSFCIILGGFIFITPAELSSGNIPDSSTISIRILDYTMGWCGGSTNESGSLIEFDYYGMKDFVIGIANLDSEPHSLEEISIIMAGASEINNTGFEITRSISDAEVLPVMLLSNQYFKWNITTIGCTISIKVLLTVDSTVIDFGVISQGDRGFQTQLLTIWPNVYFYTETTSTPIPILFNSVAISLLAFVLINYRRTRH